MRLLAYLKVSIKGIIKEFPALFLSYALYPIILALLIGYISTEDFKPEISQPIFSVKIIDEDDTNFSKDLTDYLKSESISKIITVKSDEDVDYTIKIPKSYSSGLIGDKNVDIKIEASEDASTSNANILVNLIDSFNEQKSKSLILEDNINKKELDRNEINTVLSDIYSSNSIETIRYSGDKTLSSYEYFSISFLGFVFILFVMAVINAENMEKEIGLYNRIMSTGITRIEYFNLNFISNYLMVLVINCLYIFTFRLSGLSFAGSLWILLVIIILQSLLITTIGNLLATIFKQKYAIMISQIYLIIHVIFGGIIGRPEDISNIKIFEFFSKYKLDMLISDTYSNYMIYNNFSSISSYLISIIILSILLYLINIIAIKRKWGLKWIS